MLHHVCIWAWRNVTIKHKEDLGAWKPNVLMAQILLESAVHSTRKWSSRTLGVLTGRSEMKAGRHIHTRWCLADRANSEISSKTNEPVQYFLGDASKSEEGQWEERAERSLGNLSSEHRKTGKAVGWTAYFFSASFGIEIPAFRHNLNIWGFGLPLPPPHPQSTVHLPSLHLLPWGARDFCMAEACVPGRRALRCRDSDCRAGMRSGRMSSGLPTCLRWALPSGVSSAWSVFSFLWNLWKMLSIFKNWAQNGKHQWSRSIEGILGRAEENVFSCHAKNDPEHNLASAKALCNPVSSSTFLVLRYSIFFCNGHCSLFSHKGRQKGYRVIQNWNNVSGFLIMT